MKTWSHEPLNPWKQAIQHVNSKVVVKMGRLNEGDGDGAAATPPPWSFEKP